LALFKNEKMEIIKDWIAPLRKRTSQGVVNLD